MRLEGVHLAAACGCEQILKSLAEVLGNEAAALECKGGLGPGDGERCTRVLVCITDQCGSRIAGASQSAMDAGEHGCRQQVRIRVGACDAMLDATILA